MIRIHSGSMSRGACTAVGLLLLFSAGCNLGGPRFAQGIPNNPAPDFALKDLDGKSVRLSQLRGKPVVLAFFGYG
jgi:cytochrome oxidase Cu insertion factor (SCO1/SenC/PrrC family)